MISKKNILNFETRRKIYALIEENPGLNVVEISKRTEIPWTTLLHHLRVLEKLDLVELKSKGRHKRIYAKNELGAQDKEILELLRERSLCRILLHFFFVPVCSQIELSKELELHPSTVSHHLEKLMKKGIIEEAPVENGIVYPYPNNSRYPRIMSKTPRGREIFYRCKKLKTFFAISRVMTAHRNNLADTRYIDEYLSFLKSLYFDWDLTKEYVLKTAEKKVIEKNGKKVTHFKLPEEEFYNFIFEIFRPPFCA